MVCTHCKKAVTLRQDGCLPRHTISITAWRPHPAGTYCPSSPKRKVVIQKYECPKSGTKPEGTNP